MRFVSALFLGLTLSACASAGVDASVPGSGESEIRASSATSLDLQTFRSVAIDNLRPFADEGVDLERGQIIFQDGASSTDLAPIFDNARLYYAVDLPEAIAPKPGTKLVYAVGLDGTATTGFGMYTSPTTFHTLNSTVLGTISDATLAHSPADLKRLLADLQAELEDACPTATITMLDVLGLVTVDSVSAKELTAAFGVLSRSPLVQGPPEMNPLAYRVPFVFASAVALGDGTAPRTVDLASLTTVSKELRESGQPFATTPSLPKPFGPGPHPG